MPIFFHFHKGLVQQMTKLATKKKGRAKTNAKSKVTLIGTKKGVATSVAIIELPIGNMLTSGWANTE